MITLTRAEKNNVTIASAPIKGGKLKLKVEGLAERIVRGDVPENLKNKQLYSLDMGALVASVREQYSPKFRLAISIRRKNRYPRDRNR